MNLVHMVLGIAVIGLNGAVGVRILLMHRHTDTDAALAGFAIGALALQIATGFFLSTAAIEVAALGHFVLPVASLVALIFARAASHQPTGTAVGAASLFAAAAAIFAFVTGVVYA